MHARTTISASKRHLHGLLINCHRSNQPTNHILTTPRNPPTAEAVNTGPLEATIASLSREIDAKGSEGRELQRRWINKQTELVALQVRGQPCLWVLFVGAVGSWVRVAICYVLDAPHHHKQQHYSLITTIHAHPCPGCSHSMAQRFFAATTAPCEILP